MPDQLIIQHCSPTLAGLKTGNMFSIRFSGEEEMVEELRALNRRLTKKGLRAMPLRATGSRCLIYIYRPDRLDEDLAAPEAVAILEEAGYTVGNASRCLAELARRMAEGESFPHEVGLFLGYPPADVQGFMAEAAKGSLQGRGVRHKSAGHWKVYGDAAEAERAFAKFRKCTHVYAREIRKGRPLEQLIVPARGKK